MNVVLRAANIPDSAVVTLNGTVTSAAATEALQLITGFTDASTPNCGWIYDGKLLDVLFAICLALRCWAAAGMTRQGSCGHRPRAAMISGCLRVQ
jgi:hypothetical protein